MYAKPALTAGSLSLIAYAASAIAGVYPEYVLIVPPLLTCSRILTCNGKKALHRMKKN
jgi:hypothetical protein